MLNAVVLAKNEAGNLENCLKSLSFADVIYLIDDFSTDKSTLIAKKYNCKIIYHRLNGDFSAARNSALKTIDSGWVLFVDADEIVSPNLAIEIVSSVKNNSYSGFYVKRIDHLWGKTLKFGDTGNTRLIRLGRTGQGLWSGQIHEKWNLNGRIGRLNFLLDHFPHKTVYDFILSLNQYSSIRSQELYVEGSKASIFQVMFYPLFKFIYLYLIKFGFLDGQIGIMHALIMSFYTFLVRGKLYLLWSQT